MTKLELKAKVNAYMIAAIDPSNYYVMGEFDANGDQTGTHHAPQTERENVNFVMDCFDTEYKKHHYQAGITNDVALFREWLMGLPSSFNIDFENYRILEISREWGALPAQATERQEQRIIDNWFNYIANKFFQLHKYLNSPAREKETKNK